MHGCGRHWRLAKVHIQLASLGSFHCRLESSLGASPRKQRQGNMALTERSLLLATPKSVSVSSTWRQQVNKCSFCLQLSIILPLSYSCTLKLLLAACFPSLASPLSDAVPGAASLPAGHPLAHLSGIVPANWERERKREREREREPGRIQVCINSS